MAIRKVARLGHPVLRQVARSLDKHEIRSPEVERLVADMVETMREYGGVGLAAPQVHEPLRLAVIEVGALGEPWSETLGQEVLVIFNAKTSVLDQATQGFWEGCLSVPGLRGYVERPKKIKVEYLDEQGTPKTIVAEDFLATVFQHELDHLDGVLYVDKIADKTKFCFTEEYQRHHMRQQEPEVD